MSSLYFGGEIDGQEGWVPTAYCLELLAHDSFGFCVNCSQENEEVAPEAVRLKCISCGQNKVFGTSFFKG